MPEVRINLPDPPVLLTHCGRGVEFTCSNESMRVAAMAGISDDGLAAVMSRYIGGRGGADGAYEAMPGFFLMRASQPKLPKHMVYRPCVCVVAQGQKRLMLGD